MWYMREALHCVWDGVCREIHNYIYFYKVVTSGLNIMTSDTLSSKNVKHYLVKMTKETLIYFPLHCMQQCQLYLCVDDGSHPKAFRGTRHREHGPEEDEDGQNQRQQRRRHNVVQDDHKITQHLRFGHHRVVKSEQQLKRPRQLLEKLVRLWDIIVLKHTEGIWTYREMSLLQFCES